MIESCSGCHSVLSDFSLLAVFFFEAPIVAFCSAVAMPDLPATSCRSVSSLQRWHNLKDIRGCLNSFSQVLKLGRILRGSSGYLSTTGPRSRSSESQQREKTRKRKSAREARMLEAEIVIDLRRILDAKQEPFVLQDVIWHKRHPVRTQSSRELKFNLNDAVSSSRKSQSTERTSSSDERKPSDVSLEESSSSAFVKRGKLPAESIVQLPSSQTAPYLQRKWSSSWKMPVSSKCPTKKALLMEAAARILEGSNSQTSRRSSATARSLPREADRLKQGSASKEVSLNKMPMVNEPANEEKGSSQSMTLLKENSAEGKSRIHSDRHGVFSSDNRSEQNSPNSMDCELQVTGEEVIRTMQCRMQPLDGLIGGNAPLMELTTAGPSTSQPPIHLQEPDSHVSNVIGMQYETSNTVADVSIKDAYCHVDLGQSDDLTHQGQKPVAVSEDVGRHHKQDDEDSLHKEQSNKKFVHQVPRLDLLSLSKQADCSTTEILKGFDEIPWSGETPTNDVEHSNYAASSGCILTGIESVSDADYHAFSDIYSNGSIKLSTGIGAKHNFYNESRSDMVDAMKNNTTPILLLCNYSWWTQDKIQVSCAGLQDETLHNSVGCDSPNPTISCPVVKKVEESSNGGNDENFEDAYTSSDHFSSDKCQHSSPVSVLEAVYDDNPSLGTPFEDFDESRQKLLESLRRYEMLVHMDLDALIKLNEENLCNEFEEDSEARSCTETWENDGYDICDEDQSMTVTDSPDQLPSKYADKEGDALDWNSVCGYDVINDDLCTRSADERFYRQSLADKNASSPSHLTADARAARVIAERESRRCKALLDRSSKRSNSGVLEGLRWQSHSGVLEGLHWRSRSQTCDFNSASAEAEHQKGSVLIDRILQMDLTTISWSNFPEETELMEMELENSVLAALIQEFLSDNWLQPSFTCPV